MEIRINNVSFSYNFVSKSEQKNFNDINMKFHSGEITCVISQSGGGKSTLLELLAGLIKPVKGNIEYGIKNLKIGYVFKNPEQQFLKATVFKEWEFVIRYLDKKTKFKKIHDMLELLDLDVSYLDRNPFSLSNGEMKKVAIASVLLTDCDVVLLDEPTVGLDDFNKNILVALLRKLKIQKKIVIIASRDTDFIHNIADNIYVINKGKVIIEGNKYDVFTSDLLAKTSVVIPRIIDFSKKGRMKGANIGYFDDVLDLMKDIYRHIK
ncbi:MAG: ABC transporter ATP-binding protein [Bacilli bacterium]